MQQFWPKHVRECGIPLAECDIPLAECGNGRCEEMNRRLKFGRERFASTAALPECGD